MEAYELTVGKLLAASNAADNMISPRERELLAEFERAKEIIRNTFGVPKTPEAEDHEANLAFLRVPGSREALNRWAEIQESLRLAGNDN